MTWINTTNEQLQVSLEQYLEELKELDQLREDNKKLNEFIDKIYMIVNSKNSYYQDELEELFSELAGKP